eukprot:221222_1
MQITSSNAHVLAKSLLHATLEEGDEWYAVSKKWYDRFKHFAYFDTDSHRDVTNDEEYHLQFENRELPPSMNDTELRDTNNTYELKRELNENQHFVWVKNELYDYFKEWFGVDDGSVSFKRQVIDIGNELQSELMIEMFPIFICYVLCANDGEPNLTTKRIISLSRHATPKALIKLSVSIDIDASLDDASVRVWRKQIHKPEPGQGGEGESEPQEGWDPFPKNKDADDEAPPSYDEAVEIISNTKEEEQYHWQLLTDGEYAIPFGQWALAVDLCSDVNYMIEMKDPLEDDAEWKRKAQKETNVDDWRGSLYVGQKIDIYDTAYSKWYTGSIIALDDDTKKTVKVHYDGYSTNYDESVTMDRIAQLNAHTAADPFWSTYTSAYTTSYNDHDTSAPKHNGCVGLRNLGNTCFMNSTIQCLCHCPLLVNYFLDKERWSKDINRDNPLGWNGKVAETWSDLLQKYWSAKYSVLSPNVLKRTIAKIQPRFSGYQQHDSSELLQFLLDGLHEDLNRIKEKPYTEKIESNDVQNLKQIAQESWGIHKARNDSVIVDSIQGQLKSRVQCPDCNRISVTFDPFMFLSVPIPTEKQFTTKVMTVIHMDLRIVPRKYAVKVEKISSISELKDALSTVTKIPKGRLIIADIWNHHIYSTYKNYDSIDRITDSDHTICYEVPSDEQVRKVMEIDDADMKFKIVGIYHQIAAHRVQSLGVPLVIKLPVNYDMDTAFIAEYIAMMIEPYTQNMDKWEPTGMSKTQENVTNEAIQSLDSDEEDNPKTLGFDSSTENEDEVAVAKKEEDEEDPQEAEPEAVEDEEEGQGETIVPYSLVLCDKYGKNCGLCSYSAYCNGCKLNRLANSKLKLSDGPYDSLSIGIRWETGAQICFNHSAFLAPLHDKSVGELSGSSKSNAYDYSYRKPQKTVHLSECINEFVAEETLSKNDAWYCSDCKEHKEAKKKLDLYALPAICIIHLKRFTQNGYYREKNDCSVQYPIKGLDLSQWIQSDDSNTEDMLYDLFAVSIHSGGLGGGHYIANAKNLDNGEWYEFDDSCVTGISEDAAYTTSAYVLFYNKRDVIKKEVMNEQQDD